MCHKRKENALLLLLVSMNPEQVATQVPSQLFDATVCHLALIIFIGQHRVSRSSRCSEVKFHRFILKANTTIRETSAPKTVDIVIISYLKGEELGSPSAPSGPSGISSAVVSIELWGVGS
jgi:hypothetical protein